MDIPLEQRVPPGCRARQDELPSSACVLLEELVRDALNRFVDERQREVRERR